MEVNCLSKFAMTGQWDNIVQAYENNPMSREAKLTRSGDTALHIAAAAGQTNIVSELVEIMGENASNVLKIQNDRGDTAFHLAAALGNEAMCHCMASKDRELISAVLHGNMAAFLCLHSYNQEKDNRPCRKNNGETILHSAIAGEYFSIAFQIMRAYADLVNSVNENGLTPLHILASKPNAFKSGSRLGLFDRIIYYCIPVNEFKVDKHDHEAHSTYSRAKNGRNHPENYETCFEFFKLINNSIGALITKTKGEADDKESPERSRYGQFFPPNDAACVLFFRLLMKALLIVLGLGFWRIKSITEKKEKHTWAYQVMNELVQRASLYKYDDHGKSSRDSRPDKDGDTFSVPETPPVLENDQIFQSRNICLESAVAVHNKDGNARDETATDQQSGRKATPILIAAKMGVTEMVEKILDTIPVAIHDLDSEKKNLVLLAVENRQTGIYKLLLDRKMLGESDLNIFEHVDIKGNSALHLAAKFGEYGPWRIPGAALQMQWEIKWYKFVKESMPRYFFLGYNNKGKTPKEIFTKTHKELVKDGQEWLSRTSESCLVVAALIASVALTTSATVPGGLNEQSGKPILENEPAFKIFAISSFVALCFSMTALSFFFSILTSTYREKDLAMALPRKLLLGLTSLFTSIAAIMISFCSGHFSVLRDEMRSAVYPLYAATCFPMIFFVLAHVPLYLDLIWAIFKKVPQRGKSVIPH
ncbi:ANK REP REGION domain-containing protein [Citrus sinensis]|nr:ANK REP REGION domain-containing protein [Citrus sinensis]